MLVAESRMVMGKAHVFHVGSLSYYINSQDRKPQAQRDWLDLLQGRAHNVHKVDVCALSLLCKSQERKPSGAARLARFTVRAGAQCPQSGRLCVEFAAASAPRRII